MNHVYSAPFSFTVLFSKQYAQEHQIVYIDLNQILSSKEAGLLPEYTYDGSHLLGRAYYVWSKAISPYVLPIK